MRKWLVLSLNMSKKSKTLRIHSFCITYSKIAFHFSLSVENKDEMENCELFMLDMSASVEVIKEPMTLNSSKIYISGKILCDSSYDYLVILSNPTQLFPSLTVLHLVDLVSKDASKPPYEISPSVQEKAKSRNVADWGFAPPSTKKNPSNDPESKIKDEEKEAKIIDLLNFVREIAKSEDLTKDNRVKKLSQKLNTIQLESEITQNDITSLCDKKKELQWSSNFQF